MAAVTKDQIKFTVRAYRGDAKTLLAFNLVKAGATNLAGFSVKCQPPQGPAYYLLNTLQFEKPGDHAQDSSQPANSSINAPFRKFRWLHVPGSSHQGTTPAFGPYTYTATPRYFDGKGSMQPLDPSLSQDVKIEVSPYVSGKLALGFTRGFTQSQAFVHHFGKAAQIQPSGRTLVYDTSVKSGTNAQGETFTFAQEYDWLGFTARQQIFGIVEQVRKDASLHLDVFAYDLNEPDFIAALLQLAAEGRCRIILDNADLHHVDPKKPAKAPAGKGAKSKAAPWEDQFETAFRQKVKPGSKAGILRGSFARYSHDKVLIVSRDGTPATASKVLTGSTNFSATGLYVNSNHVLVFDDAGVAGQYSQVFNAAWQGQVAEQAFLATQLSKQAYPFTTAGIPKMEITFSPHDKTYALTLLNNMAARVTQEGKQPKGSGSVLFAVMQVDTGVKPKPGTKPAPNPVYDTLKNLHKTQSMFSFGITDTTDGIMLYAPGQKSGVLVTGKPAGTVLPPPFDQVPGVGLGHQVHHKFVVCGFNRDDAVVYCGSSNLAFGGEQENGDNLLAIHDKDVATVFALEALGLVDHFNFLDKYAGKAAAATKTSKSKAPGKKKPASKTQAALDAKWFLDTDDKWTKSYFAPADLHCVDRLLFG